MRNKRKGKGIEESGKREKKRESSEEKDLKSADFASEADATVVLLSDVLVRRESGEFRS